MRTAADLCVDVGRPQSVDPKFREVARIVRCGSRAVIAAVRPLVLRLGRHWLRLRGAPRKCILRGDSTSESCLRRIMRTEDCRISSGCCVRLLTPWRERPRSRLSHVI